TDANYIPPGILVGFNPQPEPPARLAIEGLLHPPDPGIVLSGLDGDEVELLIGVGGGHQRLAYLTLMGASCGLDANIRLYPLFQDVEIPAECRGAFTVRAVFTDRTVLNLDLQIGASSRGVYVPPGNL